MEQIGRTKLGEIEIEWERTGPGDRPFVLVHGFTGSRDDWADVLPALAELAVRAQSRYDLTFVCEDDIPYDDTWDRSGETNRAEFQSQVLADLTARGVPFTRLRGTLEERVEQVRDTLASFSKSG